MVRFKERRGASRRKRTARPGGLLAFLGSLLMAVGLLVTITVGGMYAHGLYEELAFEQETLRRREAFEQERAVLELVRREEAERIAQQQARLERERDEAERVAQLEAALPTFERRPAVAAPPAPAKAAGFAPARRIIIPAIDVDSEVVESPIRNGEWSVPKFVVGHLQGTAQPNQPGNAVFSGHLQSVSAGNVFANLTKLRAGDQIYLLTSDGQYLYEVKETKTVANTDVSVVQPTPDPSLTLITCAGEWDFVARDYRQRTVVMASIFRDVPPERLAIQPR